MSTSERKREACRRNAQKSTGPKRTHLTRFNAVKRGSYAKEFVPRGANEKPFRQLEKKLRADLQPQGELQEIYFRRALSKEWATRQNERSELTQIEKTVTDSRSKSPAEDATADVDLLYLEPHYAAARDRRLAGQTHEETLPKSTPSCSVKATETPIAPAEIDRAILEGIAHELRRQKTPHIPVQPWTPPRGDLGKEKGKYARAMFAAWTFEAGSIWYPDKDWAEGVIDAVAKCRFDGTDESDDLEDTVVMMATYMRQRYKVERVTDINEQEEAEAAVKKIRKRGYGCSAF